MKMLQTSPSPCLDSVVPTRIHNGCGMQNIGDADEAFTMLSPANKRTARYPVVENGGCSIANYLNATMAL